MIKTIKHLSSAMAVVVFLFIAFGSEDETSSDSISSKPQVECGWCGKSFNKGSGYNTLMRVINTPETDYSAYCSRRCAKDFLRNN